MILIADFTVPAESFALADTFDDLPETTVEVDRFAVHSREWIMPYLWVKTPDDERFESALAADSTIESFQQVEDFSEATRYEMMWTESVGRTVDTVLDRGGTIAEATGGGGEWHLRVQFSDHDHLTAFREYFDHKEYEFQLHRVVRPKAAHDREYGLTPEQRETLTAAFRSGYFSVPRESTATDVAADLGISQQAVSERLRRAMESLVGHTIVVPENGEGE